MKIRRATVDDAKPLASVLKEIGWFELLNNEPLEAAADRLSSHIKQCLGDGSHSLFVAESSEGEIIGYGSVHWLPYLFLKGPEGYVSELFVRESARGQGVGRQLLAAIQQEARGRNCARLSLINLRSRESYQRQFYIKAGWEERQDAANFIYKLA
jgi:GNAT superfamily N-acetyltransferase